MKLRFEKEGICYGKSQIHDRCHRKTFSHSHIIYYELPIY